MEMRTTDVQTASGGSSVGRILTMSVQTSRSLATRNWPCEWKWQIGQSSGELVSDLGCDPWSEVWSCPG